MPSQGTTSSARSIQGKRAAARRWGHPNEAELTRDYAAAKLEEVIKRTVEAAPDLTIEQRNRLALLLSGGGANGGA